MSILLLATLLSPAQATGLPPWEAVSAVDRACEPVEEVSRPLYVTFDRFTGVCAPPGPEGDSCSSWVEQSLEASALVVRRMDCEEPLNGRFVRDGSCGEQPRWRWEGRLDTGHVHAIGRDFTGELARVRVAGEPNSADCPALSPRRDAVRTEVEVREASPPQWLAFPEEGYSVVIEGEAARLQWAPGPGLQQWLLYDEDASLRSDPMDPSLAQAVMASALREPNGLAVRHQIVQYREWYEGWRQRGVPRCERLLEEDFEQRLRTMDPEAELGPPMRGTVTLREPTIAESCFPEPRGR